MLASFLITFREALEAALIIGIIAAYVAKIGRKDLNRYIYAGIIGAMLASVGVALVFKAVYGELEDAAEQLFEGGAALTAAAVLTYMIFWMAQNSKKIKGEVQEKIDISISKGQMLGIAALSFIAVVILSFVVFKGMYRLDVSSFFKYTSILLILFSAGMVATGVHELNEAGIIPSVIEHVWDLNPPMNPDGSYPLLHEKGLIGSSLKSLLGYHAGPSLTMIIAYIGYWIIIGLFVYNTYKTKR